MNDDAPVPNRWKRSGARFWIGLMVTLMLVGLAATAVLHLWPPAGQTTLIKFPDAQPAAAAQPPAPRLRISETTSEGGTQSVRANSEGARVALHGDKVEGKDLAIAPTSLVLPDIGSLTGGAFSGSLSASVSGQMWIRIAALLLAIGLAGLAVWNFKKAPTDWHFWGGLGVGSAACLVVAANPELLYVGLGGLAVAGAANFLPTIFGSRVLSAAQNYEDFFDDPANADVKARWVAYRASKVTRKDQTAMDELIRKSNV